MQRTSALALLLAPVVTATLLITVLAAFGPVEPLLGGRFGNWVASMIVFMPSALVAGVSAIGWDRLVHHVLGWKAIEAKRAIVVGCTAAFAISGCYELVRPGQFDQGIFWLLAILLPPVVLPGVLRVTIGPRHA